MPESGRDTMPRLCLNFDTGEYELIDRYGFSYTRGEFVCNWDVSVYDEEKAEEDEKKNDAFDDEDIIFEDDESEEAYLFEEEDDYFEEEEGDDLGINSESFFDDDIFGDDGGI